MLIALSRFSFATLLVLVIGVGAGGIGSPSLGTQATVASPDSRRPFGARVSGRLDHHESPLRAVEQELQQGLQRQMVAALPAEPVTTD